MPFTLLLPIIFIANMLSGRREKRSMYFVRSLWLPLAQIAKR